MHCTDSYHARARFDVGGLDFYSTRAQSNTLQRMRYEKNDA